MECPLTHGACILEGVPWRKCFHSAETPSTSDCVNSLRQIFIELTEEIRELDMSLEKLKDRDSMP